MLAVSKCFEDMVFDVLQNQTNTVTGVFRWSGIFFIQLLYFIYLKTILSRLSTFQQKVLSWFCENKMIICDHHDVNFYEKSIFSLFLTN